MMNEKLNTDGSRQIVKKLAVGCQWSAVLRLKTVVLEKVNMSYKIYCEFSIWIILSMICCDF